jgi:hypothetical protein
MLLISMKIDQCEEKGANRRGLDHDTVQGVQTINNVQARWLMEVSTPVCAKRSSRRSREAQDTGGGRADKMLQDDTLIEQNI